MGYSCVQVTAMPEYYGVGKLNSLLRFRCLISYQPDPGTQADDTKLFHRWGCNFFLEFMLYLYPAFTVRTSS
jgi:hypothetical protein